MPRKPLSAFDNLNKEELLEIVRNEAGDRNSESLIVVASRIIDIPEYSCTINIRAEENVSDFMTKWTNKFIKGYLNRPSQRTSNPIGTQHDPILDEIILARINHTTDDLENIKYGHRLSMSAENIAGAFLEEYIAQELLSQSWHCCWGETMKSIDFCNVDGQLLQIKNSDNSENSSSKTVRDGTPIKYWFRRFSKTGTTNWNALNKLVGIDYKDDQLNEDSFKAFVREAVSNNPGSVFLEEESPFYGNKD
ncbi:MAG: SinI family restriction endonuclease [Peptostreptococcaceae bacterium]|nr:SinI family restriction endonuclease [Peptostreptococcaceae bacterium]